MITKEEYRDCVRYALQLFDKAHIHLTEDEKSRIEVADFGLGMVREIGLELLTYINTNRVCAKEMAIFPGQLCPEHCHVASGSAQGKEETFRCRYGMVYLYVEGEGNGINGGMPDTTITAYKEIVLQPGEQYTIYPGTRHWFRGGDEGAVVSEFSTHSDDATDCFTDDRIIRATQISDAEGTNGAC